MKKITALLLVLALILSLGACSKAPAEDATDAPTNAATDPATDAPTGGDTNPASYEWPMVGSVENVKIVEQGIHASLLAPGGFYATLYYSQFKQA